MRDDHWVSTSSSTTQSADARHLIGERLTMSGNEVIRYADREGARVQEAHTGRWYWDCRRNGSLYNLGHLPAQDLHTGLQQR